MKEDDLDRVLSGEIDIAPSPGFVRGVMAAVHRQTSASSPIPFPWMRALPGLAAGLFALAAMIVAVLKSAGRPESSPAQSWWMFALANAAEIAKKYGIDWIVLATLITAACLVVSMRLVNGRRALQ